jgi:TolB-like protein/Flp pilus assembly protein TadD
VFAQSPGKLLSKAMLMDAVWPDVVVSDDSLVQCVGELRLALGSQGGALIRTLSRRGYLLDAQPCDDGASPAAPPSASVLPDAAAAAAVSASSPDGTPDEASARPPHPRRRMVLPALASIALLALGLVEWQTWLAPARTSIDREMAARKSIAVMPFSDFSEKPSPWFAEAVTRELITDIARVPNLLVITAFTTAAAGTAPTDPRELAKKLGAQHFLVGSVRRAGPSLQVSAQLVAVGSGAALWTDRFDYPAMESSDWQRDIFLRVASAMEVSVQDEAARQRRSKGDSLDAADHVMEGRYILRRNAVPDDMVRARAHFDAALASDPDSVGALTGWAATHYGKLFKRWSTNPKEDVALATQAIDRALAIDPHYAPAHAGRADLLFLARKFEESLGEYETAVRLDPSEARNYTRIGFIKLALGRPDEVAAHMAQAERINPLEIMFIVSYARTFAGVAEFHLGHDEAAYERLRETAALNPKYATPYAYMASIDALHGRTAEAAVQLAEFRRLLPNQTIHSLRAGEFSQNERYLVGANRYFEGLRQAGLPE